MIKKNLIISLLILFFYQFSAGSQVEFPVVGSLVELKNAVKHRDIYLRNKLRYIAQVRSNLDTQTDLRARFRLHKELFQLYYDFQIDSSLIYADHMLTLSVNQLKNFPVYKLESLIFKARGYARRGMYQECSALLNKVGLEQGFSDALKPFYFAAQLELNKGLADYTIDEAEQKTYRLGILNSLDSLLKYTPQQSVWHSIYLGSKLRIQGQYERAIEVLLRAYKHLPKDHRDMAHVAFYMADLYRLTGHKEAERQFLILSALTDVKYAVKEYVSLWKLAIELYDAGDVETAYGFMEVSLEDAKYSNAFRWIQQISKVLPKIYQDYNLLVIRQRNAVFAGFAFIVCLLVGIVWQNRKLRKIKNQLLRSNEELTDINLELNIVSNHLNLSNAELQLNNSQLLFLNTELASMSLLKETYLSKFIDLCSDYIDKLDEYRVGLKRLLKDGKMENLQKELQSTKYVEQEYKAFLLNFDQTFLRLYPDFIAEFNGFFLEEDHVELKKNELLNTELRIYALARLGITDGNKIARFLRCSITTIYTYKSKIRNKSICPDSFEECIIEAGNGKYLLSTHDEQ